MNNINDIKHFCREIEEAYYAGSETPIDCVNYIMDWLNLKEKEEHNIECLESTCEYYKSECEELKGKYEDLEHEYDHLEFDCEVLENSNNFLKEWNNSIKQKYDEMTTSFINSLIQTNTLVSGQKTYLMYDDITQKFKIGKSYDPYKREKTLCSDRCSIYLVAYCDYDIESVLHSMYSEYRGRGEWFSLSINQVRYIIDYFGMKITNQDKLNEFYYTDLEPFLNPKY